MCENEMVYPPISASGFLRDHGVSTMSRVILGLHQNDGIFCQLQMGSTFSLSSLGAKTNMRFFKPLGSLDGLLLGSLVGVLVGISSLPLPY